MSPLTRSDTHYFLYVGNEDFSIADPTRLRGHFNGLYDLCYEIIADDYFHFYLWNEIDNVFRTTVQFRMTFLSAESLDLAYRYPLNPDLVERLLYFIKLERLNNCLNLFQLITPLK